MFLFANFFPPNYASISELIKLL
uniref:Uncharacterized protein n=1 Tax=Anguilla anguilla TaxID=7936 RepID=A0A0E9U6R1_ANGAN